MTKRFISILISMLVLLSCVCMPVGTAFAEDAAADEGFSWTQDFTDVTIAEGTTDKATVSAATGMAVSYDAPANSYSFKTDNGKLVVASSDNTISPGNIGSDGKTLGSHSVNLTYNFPNELKVKTGVIITKMTINVTGSGYGNWNLSTLAGEKATSTTTYEATATVSKPEITLYTVYSRLSENDNWIERRYEQIGSGTKKLIRTKEYDKAEYTYFSQFKPVSTYAVYHPFSAEFDDFSVEYTPASEVIENIDFSQDFSDVALESTTSLAEVENATGLTFTPDSLSLEGAYTYSVNNGALEASYNTAAASSKGYRIYTDYDMPVSFKTGKFTTKLVISAGGDVHRTRYILSPKSGDNVATMFQPVIYQNTTNFANQENSGTKGVVTNAFSPVNGKFYLRMEISRLSENDDWIAVLYNDGTPNHDKLITQKIYSKDTYPSIDGIRLLGSYGNAAAKHIDYIHEVSVDYTPAEELKRTSFVADFENVTSAANADVSTLSEETGLEIVKADLPSLINVDTTDGNLKYTTSSGNNGARLNVHYALPAPIIKGFADVSFSVTRTKTNGSETYLNPSDSKIIKTYNASTGAENFYGDENFKSGISYNGGWKAGSNAATAPKVDSDGTSHLRAVWSRPDAQSDWNFIVYDVLYANPVVIYSGTIPQAELSHISRIKLFTNYCIGGELEIAFDDIKIKTSYDYDNRFSLKQNFDALDDVTYTLTQAKQLTDTSATGGIQLVVNDAQYPDILAGIKDGKLFLENNSADGKYSSVAAKANLPLSVYYGAVEASMTVDAYEAGEKGATHFFNLSNTDGQSVGTFQLTDVGSYFRGDPDDSKYYTGRTKDNEKFRIRIVASRPNKESNWIIKFYDDNAGECFGTKEVAKEDLTRIDVVTFFSAYTYNHKLEADDFRLKASSWSADINKVTENFNNLENGAAYTQGAFKAATDLRLTQGGESTAANGAFKLYGKFTSPAGQYPALTYDLPVDVANGTLTASLKIPAESVTKAGIFGSNISFFMISDGTNTSSWETFKYSNGLWWTTNDAGNSFSITGPSVDDNGAYNLRAVITPVSEENSWNLKIYDDSKAQPSVLLTKTFTMSAIKKLTIAKITTISTDLHELGGDGYVLLDDVKVRYSDGTELPEIEEEEEVVVVNRKSNIEFNKDTLYFSAEEGDVSIIGSLKDITAEIFAQNPKGAKEDFQLVLAAYSGGRLLNVAASELYTPDASGNYYTVTLTGFENADDIKLFFVSDIAEMWPLQNVVRVQEVLSSTNFQ